METPEAGKGIRTKADIGSKKRRMYVCRTAGREEVCNGVKAD
jgi:hypothetical protein